MTAATSAPAPGAADAPEEALAWAEPASPHAAARARRGVFWALANNGGRQLIAFVAFLGLARMLTPEAFGVVALASVFMLLGNVLLEQGLGEALVQTPALRRLHADSALWTMLAAGVLLSLATWLGAPSLASALGEPMLAELLPVLALQFPLNALALVPQALLQRRMDFRPLAMRGLLSLACGCALALAFAYQGFGPWSLVAQQLGGALVGAAVLWGVSPWRPRCRFSPAHLVELHRFGRNLLGTGLLDLFNRKFDDFLIGAVLGSVALGFYNVAYQALLIIEQLVSKGFDAIALSALSRLQHDRAAVAAALRTTVRYASAVAVPVFLLALLFAESLIGLAFGERWLPAAEVLRVLAVAGALHTVFHYNHAMFKALGRPGISVRLAAIGAVINLVGFAIAVHWGIVAVAWAYVIRGYLLAPLTLHYVRELTAITPIAYVRLLLPSLAGGALLAASVLALRATWPQAESLVGTGTSLVLALAAYLLLIDRLSPDLRRALCERASCPAEAQANAVATR